MYQATVKPDRRTPSIHQATLKPDRQIHSCSSSQLARLTRFGRHKYGSPKRTCAGLYIASVEGISRKPSHRILQKRDTAPIDSTARVSPTNHMEVRATQAAAVWTRGHRVCGTVVFLLFDLGAPSEGCGYHQLHLPYIHRRFCRPLPPRALGAPRGAR
eukprot:8711498-Pyramimonas_sp.AAC.1